MSKTNGARNKRAGSDAERLYAIKFRELGFDFCQTSRYGSKLHDNSKIDLIHIPYNIQIKAGVQKSMNPGKELLLMDTCVKLYFPPFDAVHKYPKLLIHHKRVGYGKKRTPEDALVYMSLKQFMFFQTKVGKLEYMNIKKGKIESQSEFSSIVCMTFDYFIEKIVNKTYHGNNKREILSK